MKLRWIHLFSRFRSFNAKIDSVCQCAINLSPQPREVRLVNESLKWMAFTSNEYELAENPGSWNVWKYVGMKKDTFRIVRMVNGFS